MTENSLNIEVMQRLIRTNQRLLIMCFCLLIIAPVAGKSVAGVLLNLAKRCGNSGEAVKLVQSIGNQYKDVSLYNESVTMVASWKDISNEIQYIDPNYKGRIYMDEKRNIWILGVERRDAGKYFVKFRIKNETHNIELFVKEEPTEKQLQECQNNHPDSQKEGCGRSSLEDNRITLILMFMIFTWLIVLLDKGRKLVMFANTQCVKKKLAIDQMGEHMQKCLGIYPLLMERYLGNLTEDQIREQIQKLLCVYPGLFMKKFLELLMEDQVKKMLTDNPDFMEKYDQNGIHPTNPPTVEELTVTPKQVANETEDNQCPLVSPKGKFISPKICGVSGSDQNGIHPTNPPTLEDLAVIPKKVANETEDNQCPLVSPKGKFISPKMCGDSGSDQNGIHPTNPPTLEELAVIPKEVANETEDNQRPLVSPKGKFISPKICGDSGSDQNGIHPTNPPTLEELAVTPKEMANETEDNQCPLVSPKEILVSPKMCSDSSSDQPENYNYVFKTALSHLPLKPMDAGTERKGNQMKWLSSKNRLVTSWTGISSNSDSLNEYGHSSIKPFNVDEQNEDLEGHIAQTESGEFFGASVKEDSNSEDECKKPLLKVLDG